MAFEDGGQGGGDQGAIGGAADLLGGGAGGGEQQQGGAGAAAGGDGTGGGDGGAGAGGGFEFLDKLAAAPGDGESSSNRDWVSSKGFKSLDALVQSARHAEKAIHDKGMIAVPKEDAAPEAIAAFRAAIGVPDKPEGYEVKGPEGVALNEPLIAALRESGVKHGASKGAFEGMVGDFIQAQLDEQAAENTRIDGEASAWLKEQGGKADEQRAHIDAAARALQLTRDEMLWFRTMPSGAGRALGLLAKLGSGMAEDTLLTGGKGRFGITGAEAQTTLNQMKADPEVFKKVMTPGSPERARWDRLNQAAAEWKTAQGEAM